MGIEVTMLDDAVLSELKKRCVDHSRDVRSMM